MKGNLYFFEAEEYYGKENVFICFEFDTRKGKRTGRKIALVLVDNAKLELAFDWTWCRYIGQPQACNVSRVKKDDETFYIRLGNSKETEKPSYEIVGNIIFDDRVWDCHEAGNETNTTQPDGKYGGPVGFAMIQKNDVTAFMKIDCDSAEFPAWGMAFDGGEEVDEEGYVYVKVGEDDYYVNYEGKFFNGGEPFEYVGDEENEKLTSICKEKVKVITDYGIRSIETDD